MPKYFILLLVLFNLWTACSPNPSSNASKVQLAQKEQSGLGGFVSGEMEKSLESDEWQNTDKDQTTVDDGTSSTATSPKRVAKLIKEARISYQVKNYTKAKQAILQLLQQSDAYLAGEQESGTRSGQPLQNQLAIRVKAAQFDRFVQQLMELALHVDYKNITVKDITEQYLDMDARLSARKAVEQRYIDILKEAKNVEEILQVEEKLQDVREEIESAQGKLQYWDSKIGYSTIDLTFYELQPNTVVRTNGFFYQIERGLRNGWEGILLTFIGLINIWPLLIIGGIFAFWLRRRYKRKKA